MNSLDLISVTESSHESEGAIASRARSRNVGLNDFLGQTQYFTTLDLFSGYWQAEMNEGVYGFYNL